MSSFVPNKCHLQELLIYFFNLKKSADQAHRLLVEAYGEAALSERSCREWFQKFKNGKNSCCVFGGISLVSCIMSCSNRAKPLLELSTEHN